MGRYRKTLHPTGLLLNRNVPEVIGHNDRYMRLKSTEKLSHENVYKYYDDKTSTDPEDFKKMFTSCSGGRGWEEGDEYREHK